MSTRPQLVFDYAQTKTFLAAISGDWETELFTWQCVDDNRDRKIKSKVENNTLENIAGFLETKNRNGHAIFVTVNKTDGTGREARNIVSIRAIWCDWDHADRHLPAWPLAPHITVNTSPGKYQFLWCCESLSPETFKQAMTRMIELGSDPAAKDVSRVLRVPGFFHQKKCAAKDQIGAPFLVQITQQNDIPHYTAAEIAAAFRPLKPNGHDHTPPEPPASLSPAEEARLRCALEVIPADERKIWLTVGMALHAVGARTIWDDWSKTCPEAFDQADQDKTWAGFKDDRENGITIATAYHMACKAGWHEPSRAKPDDGYVPPGEASVPPAPPNRDNLVISAWLTKEIPPRDHLLGGIMCTTSRLLVLGETGIGKTLVGMAMGGAISAGMNFLRWAGQRRSRVMYLDGELPIETFKERMELVAALYGQDIEFYGYNRDDLGDGQMPPLNIEDGQKWLRREIEAINPDLIFFDSIMSLLMGTMSEEESWTPMKRLVRELTSRRIAQA